MRTGWGTVRWSAALSLPLAFLLTTCVSQAPKPRTAHGEAAGRAAAQGAAEPTLATKRATVEQHAVDDQVALPTIRLATFNIQVFGQKKASNVDVLRQLASIVRKYDIVAVQEIRDVRNRVPYLFLEAINASRADYAMVVSDLSGREPDDKHSRERYAYYYRKDVAEPVGESTLYDDSKHDHFQREPFITRFVVYGTQRLTLINIHTRPREAVKEMAALEHVFAWVRANGAASATASPEHTVIALGDFNAGCGYASERDVEALPIHGENYDWVVPHSADTNLADSQCPYDRVVVSGPNATDTAVDWGVDRAFTDKRVSDHWPVWVELRLAPER